MACSVSLSVLAQIPLHHPRPSSFVNTGASELIPIVIQIIWTYITYKCSTWQELQWVMKVNYILSVMVCIMIAFHISKQNSPRNFFPQISQLQANNCTHFTWIILHVNCILYSDIWRYTIKGKSKPFQPINLQTLSCDVLKDQIEY